MYSDYSSPCHFFFVYVFIYLFSLLFFIIFLLVAEKRIISESCLGCVSRVLIQKHSQLIRDSRIMAYFRHCFPMDMNITTNKELAHALASQSPYVVPISSIKIRHLHCQVCPIIDIPLISSFCWTRFWLFFPCLLFLPPFWQVPSTEIFYSLNATIVGLAVSSEDSEDFPWCVGLGKVFVLILSLLFLLHLVT